MLLLAVRPVAAVAKDGGGDVRAASVCGRATSELRLKRDHGRIEVRFRVAHARARRVWRVTLVHERRVTWRGAATTTGRDGSFEVRRVLPDLPGADTVSARALGPRGLVCRVMATLPDS